MGKQFQEPGALTVSKTCCWDSGAVSLQSAFLCFLAVSAFLQWSFFELKVPQQLDPLAVQDGKCLPTNGKSIPSLAVQAMALRIFLYNFFPAETHKHSRTGGENKDDKQGVTALEYILRSVLWWGSVCPARLFWLRLAGRTPTLNYSCPCSGQSLKVFRSSGPHLFLLKATSPMTGDATAHPRSPSMTIPGQ